MTHYVNPDLEAFQQKNPITVTADQSTCNFHIFVGPWSNFTDCDRAQDFLTKAGLSFTKVDAPGQRGRGADRLRPRSTVGTPKKWQQALTCKRRLSVQRPTRSKINYVMVELILVIMVLYVTMVYGPIAAFLVELFPTKIRYTSMSLPYHIGNGWFGGMLPLLATAIVAATGNIYDGLWYPIVIAVMTFIVGALFLRDTKDVDIVTGSGVAEQAKA